MKNTLFIVGSVAMTLAISSLAQTGVVGPVGPSDVSPRVGSSPNGTVGPVGSAPARETLDPNAPRNTLGVRTPGAPGQNTNSFGLATNQFGVVPNPSVTNLPPTSSRTNGQRLLPGNLPPPAGGMTPPLPGPNP